MLGYKGVVKFQTSQMTKGLDILGVESPTAKYLHSKLRPNIKQWCTTVFTP